jgi:hypothetical protein
MSSNGIISLIAAGYRIEQQVFGILLRAAKKDFYHRELINDNKY